MKLLLMMAALSLAAPQAAATQTATGTIRVVVRVPGTRQPLAGVQVVASPGVVISSLTSVSSFVADGGTGLVIIDGARETVVPAKYQIAEILFTSNPSNGNKVPVIDLRTAVGTPPGTPLPKGSIAAVTDADGVALLRGLGFGDYAIHTQSDGYVTPAAEPAGKTAHVSGEQLSQEISLFLIRAAAITGRITDATGMPLAGTRVVPAVVGYKDGRRSLVPAGYATSTDGNGTYILDRLTPRNYYVVAEGLQAGPAAIDTYYPGVSNFMEATLIPTQSGAEVTGIDFGHRSAGFKISGKVINPGVTVSDFTLLPHDIAEGDIAPLRFPSLRNMLSSRDGTFSITGIPPGTWDLIPVVSHFRTSAAEPVTLAGRVRVDVVDRDLTGILVATTSTDVSGRVFIAGARPPGVSLVPRNLAPQYAVHLRATPGPTGDFTLRMAPPGDYRIQTLPPSGYYLADIRLGSRSIYDSAALHITEEPIEPIEILMKAGGGSISGRVLGAENFSDVRVVLVPSERLRKNALLYKTATLTPDRPSFNFANVAPGEYKVFAFSSLPPGAAEQDPKFIAEQEQEGTPIMVADGGSIEISPKLISLK